MSRIAWDMVIVLVSFAVAAALGYRAWRRRRALLERLGEAEGEPPRSGMHGAVPLAGGIAAGLALICAAAGVLAADDRFYQPAGAVRISIALLLAGGLVLAGDRLAALFACVRAGRFRWVVNLLLQVAAACIVVAAGVQFRVVGIGAEPAVELGAWAAPLTVLWLLVAMNVMKLFDGIEGAANVVLLVAAAAIFYVTLGAGEHFLNTLALAVLASTLASMRFNFFPARLPISGSGTALLGFVFAVLTVLARQKTVAALLLVFPLVVLVILVGGAMLSVLERNLGFGNGDERR